MPFSNTEQISPIMAEVVRYNPRSILDVGCGLGVYGMLCRIHLDLYSDSGFYKKLDKSTKWNTRIDGIEGCAVYTPFIPGWAYDQLYTQNALDIAPTLPDGSYDLILILAMLEHLSHEQGIQLLNHLKRIGKAIILSVPKHWQAQEIPGYPLETHRSHWTEQDLRQVGFTRFLPHWGAWLAIYGIPEDAIDHDERAAQKSADRDVITDLERKIEELNINVGKIQADITESLANQQIIKDRLSFSKRWAAWKKRFSK